MCATQVQARGALAQGRRQPTTGEFRDRQTLKTHRPRLARLLVPGAAGERSDVAIFSVDNVGHQGHREGLKRLHVELRLSQASHLARGRGTQNLGSCHDDAVGPAERMRRSSRSTSRSHKVDSERMPRGRRQVTTVPRLRRLETKNGPRCAASRHCSQHEPSGRRAQPPRLGGKGRSPELTERLE